MSFYGSGPSANGPLSPSFSPWGSTTDDVDDPWRVQSNSSTSAAGGESLTASTSSSSAAAPDPDDTDERAAFGGKPYSPPAPPVTAPTTTSSFGNNAFGGSESAGGGGGGGGAVSGSDLVGVGRTPATSLGRTSSSGGWGPSPGLEEEQRRSYLFSQPGERDTSNSIRQDEEVYNYRPPAFGNNSRVDRDVSGGSAGPTPPYSRGGNDSTAYTGGAAAGGGFAPRAFNSHIPSSMLPNRSHDGSSHPASQGQSRVLEQPRQIVPGYPMPQGLAGGNTGYSPFARVDSLGTRREAPEDMYGVPENFLEVEVRNPMTHGEQRRVCLERQRRMNKRRQKLMISHFLLRLTRLRKEDVYRL